MIVNELDIDIWLLGKTWEMKQNRLESSPANLVQTAFFNFSAIVYSINQQKFYQHTCFQQFLSQKYIDILYDENPNIQLCIINSLFYKENLQMQLSNNLKRWIVKYFDMSESYEQIQLNHWKKIIYSKKQLQSFYRYCNQN